MRLELVVVPDEELRKVNLKKVIIFVLVCVLCLGLIFVGTKQKNANNGASQNTAEEDEIQLIEEEIEMVEIEVEKPKLPQLTETAKQKVKGIYHSEEKVAYLTFDDGPSLTVTPFILDLLKENNIKATFFTLGKNVEIYPDLVKREYNEGHYVANHGYSHVYKEIYASTESAINEFQRTEVAIQKAIGIPEYNSHLVRFPGGSRGNKYEGIITETAKILEENEIAYVDWNCLTGDSAGKHDKQSLINELINTSTGKNSIVILMHDASDKILTYEILQDVINYLREQGYSFKSFYDLMD